MLLLGQAGVDDPEVLDNGDEGYFETGGPWSSGPHGFNRGQRSIDITTPPGVRTATWSFDDLPNGDYEVYVTWEPDPAESAAVMGRPQRASEGGQVYHVLNRDNARMAIFDDDSDYEAFEIVCSWRRSSEASHAC